MHQIYITALVTSVFTLIIAGGLIKWKSDNSDLKLLIMLLIIELPVSPAVYYLVRMPLIDGPAKLLVADNPGLYGFIKSFYAPLTEEPAKLLPLLIPAIRNKITKENFVWAAMTLGLGFGIGEIWLIAGFIASAGAYAELSWYMFGGFINERFMVCIIHGGFTAAALCRPGNKLFPGLMLAVLLHYAGNFPVYLAGIGAFGIGKYLWQMILTLYLILFFIGSIVLLVYFRYGKIDLSRFIHGKSVCPECNHEYSSPVLGVNWFFIRYEKCPACNKWHWVRIFRKN